MVNLTVFRKCDQRSVRRKDGAVVGVRLGVWEAISKSRDVPAFMRVSIFREHITTGKP